MRRRFLVLGILAALTLAPAAARAAALGLGVIAGEPTGDLSLNAALGVRYWFR